ncbi:MAG TPA: DUF4307 domain-containing protein [Rhodoglobus sp.]|nr:DUF4307 domain-containing protein [Rhodoglobus sp.]
MTQPTTLDERYGRTPDARRRVRWIAIGTAVLFAVAFAAWLVWGGLGGAPAQLQTRDIAHTIVDDRTVEVRWSFSVEPGTPAQCAVQALNESFGIVGWKVVDVPASDRYTRQFTETVLTSEQAVTGLIYRCWLA